MPLASNSRGASHSIHDSLDQFQDQDSDEDRMTLTVIGCGELFH